MTGIAVMVGLHLLLGYALLTGLAHKAVKWVQKPITAAIIPEELPPPPPPTPPPKIERLVEQVKVQQAPPPPTYVPPPDTPVVTAAPTAPTITAVQHTEPVAPLTPTPTPPTPPAPIASAKTDIGVACPNYGQTLQSALEGRYDKVGIAGTVKVQFKVQGNAVKDVVILSGPREYHRAVLAAVQRFTCSTENTAEALVTFNVFFRAE
jgi:protein TonB